MVDASKYAPKRITPDAVRDSAIVHYHPSHGLSEITHSVRRISQQVADIERRERDTSNTLLEFVLELSRLRKALNIPAAA